MSYAAVTSCGTGTTSINTISTTASETPAGDCGVADLGFNTWVVTPTATGGTEAGPAATAIDLSTTGGTITGGNTISNIGLDFAAAFTTSTHHSAQEVNETISYLVTPNLASEPTTPASGDVWALNGVTALNILGATITGGPGIPTTQGMAGDVYIQVTETVCIGQLTLAGCATTNEATVTATIEYTGKGTTLTLSSVSTSSSCGSVAAGLGCSASGGAITFNSTFTAFISDDIVLNHPADPTGADTYDLSFTSFDDPFSQEEVAPEPSTFILLGSALAGLGAIRLRKRKP